MQGEQYNLLDQIGDDEEPSNINFNRGRSSGRTIRDETATPMRTSGHQFDPRTPFSGIRQPVTELRQMFRNQFFGRETTILSFENSDNPLQFFPNNRL